MAKQKTNDNIFKDHEVMWKYVKGIGNWNSVIEVNKYDSWSVNLSGEEVEELEGELQGYLDEAVDFAKEQGKEVDDVADLYKVNKDGKKYIQFKRKGYNGENTPPKLYNIHGDETTGQVKTEPGGGSTLRLRVMVKPYFMPSKKVGKVEVPSIVGLSYQLLAVQIIENKEYAGQSGFGDESGGAKETAPFDTPVTTEDSDY